MLFPYKVYFQLINQTPSKITDQEFFEKLKEISKNKKIGTDFTNY